MSRHSSHLSSYLKSRREKPLTTDSRSPSSENSKARHKVTTKQLNGKQKSLNSQHKLGQKNESHSPLHLILPPELVSKIFCFLTPSEILTCAQVCKSWSEISNEMSLWIHHYNLIPRSIRDSILPNERTSPKFQWKSEIIKRTVNHRNKKIKTMIKKTSPYSGLPSGIEQALKFLSLKWQIKFTDRDGNERAFLSDDMFYFAQSLTARWYTLQLPSIAKLKSVSISALTAVFYHRDWKPHADSATRKALLHSFQITDLKLSRQTCISEDEMVTLHTVPPGIMVAVWKHSWKDGGEVAWVSMCLHYHQLLERILNGSRESAYKSLIHKPKIDDIDPFYGLQRYSATVELRNQRKLFWGNHYRELYRRSFSDGSLVLESHEEQEGMFNVKTSLPWKTAGFRNILSDIVVLDLTLMDEHKAPMWCASSAVKVRKTTDSEVDYTFSDCESTVVEYQDSVGRLRIHLVWIEEDGQNLVKGLEIYLQKDVINNWFGTSY
ncbi:F-box only protein 15-like isoform X2 [Dendronephthya gigantea]|uniref:F-box only protein 15-like isoform X2 n=1 Tax=Dendronephthya gigantea TaxID=151771 RepID=UPI00106C5BA2|nr:F-box only protein 15-like isoform X2 [Dendronephthya gigantea]